MICTQTVIDQNQRTIAYMNAQDYCAAVVSSSSALQYHGTIAANIMQRELPHQNSSRSEQLTYDQCMLLLTTNIDESTDDETENHSFVYNHGIPLPNTVIDTDIITPILIFNAALAHHLLARHCNDERSPPYLRRATRLYALAYDAPYIDQNPLFQFAVINNAAVIDRHFGNMESWNASMEYLLSLYMALMVQGCASIIHHMRGFLVNAVPASPVAHVA